MNRFLIILLSVVLLSACKSKQKGSGNGDVPLTFEDFEAFFNEGELPYKLTPEILLANMPDSLSLDKKVIQQFLTDTLTQGDFSKTAGLKYFPLQQIKGADLRYFLVKAKSGQSVNAYLCFLDKKGKYLNSMLVGKAGGNSPDVVYFSLDKKSVIKVSTEKKLNGRTALKEDFYTANPAGQVSLIMTNSNEPAISGQVFNPIDTLPRKHKLSGDYMAGDLNLVSIRDGVTPKTFQFFITFYKANGACKGELSGEGHFTSANRGEYKDKETSCGISFQFSGTRVSIQEIGGCGAFRSVKCFFEGAYVKKAEKKKTEKKK
jgi:hypothetical protein